MALSHISVVCVLYLSRSLFCSEQLFSTGDFVMVNMDIVNIFLFCFKNPFLPRLIRIL